MDGNGRWATQRGLPRVAGHRVGGAAARRIVERALNTGLAFLTLYAFSADNWRRPPAEVQKIFRLLRAFLRLELERFRKRGVRLEAIGRRDRLPEIGRECGHAVVVRMLIARTEEKGCAGERVGGVEA
jgi:undecaprenyl diphosphate synthase